MYMPDAKPAKFKSSLNCWFAFALAMRFKTVCPKLLVIQISAVFAAMVNVKWALLLAGLGNTERFAFSLTVVTPSE